MIARRQLFSFLAVAPLAAVAKPAEPKHVEVVLEPGEVGTFVHVINGGNQPVTVFPGSGMVVVR
jgi:hypothetical protein